MSQIQSELIRVCSEHGKEIRGLTHDGLAVNGPRLLLTIAGLESDWGRLREFVRYEAGYGPGGHYYKNSSELRARYNRWGVLAASSFGTFQIMHATACEIGFYGHPIDLQKDNIGCFWAMQLITKRFIGRLQAKTLRDVLDAYNSGSPKDAIVPAHYIEKGIGFYNDLPSVT